jgi:Mg2+-importing ATPase
MISMALATPFLPFLPLTATQVLLNNLLSDLPLMAIAGDAVDSEQIERAQRWSITDLRRFMVVFGLVSSLFDGLTFVTLLQLFHADSATFRTSWFVVSLLTELAVILVLRTSRPAVRSRASRMVLATTAVVAAGALALPYAGPLATLLGFTPLPLPLLLATIAIVVGYVVATEIVKWWYFAHERKTEHGAIG